MHMTAVTKFVKDLLQELAEGVHGVCEVRFGKLESGLDAKIRFRVKKVHLYKPATIQWFYKHYREVQQNYVSQ